MQTFVWLHMVWFRVIWFKIKIVWHLREYSSSNLKCQGSPAAVCRGIGLTGNGAAVCYL